MRLYKVLPNGDLNENIWKSWSGFRLEENVTSDRTLVEHKELQLKTLTLANSHSSFQTCYDNITAVN